LSNDGRVKLPRQGAEAGPGGSEGGGRARPVSNLALPSAGEIAALPPSILCTAARGAAALGLDLRPYANGVERLAGAGPDPVAGNLAGLIAMLGLPPHLLTRYTAALDEALDGARSPFRIGADSLLVLDQRQFPGWVVETPCPDAAEAAAAIRDGAVQGAGVIAAVGSFALSLSASPRKRREWSPADQVSAIQADAQSIVEAGRWVAPLVGSLERLLGAARAWMERPSEEPLSEALWVEASAVAAEEVARLVRLAAVGLGVLRAQLAQVSPDRRIRILVHGPLGALSFGALGTATGALQAARDAGLPLHVWVAEGRPPLTGVRTAWELGQAGVGHGIVPDSAVPNLLSAPDIDVVLLGSYGVTLDGSVIDEPGAHGLAELAARRSVPVYVFAPGSTLRAPNAARQDAYDVTPPEVVSGFVTEAGIVRPPFREGLEEAAALSSRGALPAGLRQ
jgi:methylthioribose-1-phosphate isomerase